MKAPALVPIGPLATSAVRCACGAFLFEREQSFAVIKGKYHSYTMSGGTVTVVCRHCGRVSLHRLDKKE